MKVKESVLGPAASGLEESGQWRMQIDTDRVLTLSIAIHYRNQVLFMYPTFILYLSLLFLVPLVICTSLFRLQRQRLLILSAFMDPPFTLLPLLRERFPGFSWYSGGASVVATITLSSVLCSSHAMG